MQKVVHFRILLDHDNDVFRDIEIGVDQNFQQFHDIVLEAIAFENTEMASFYVSNEDWEKGQEITLMDMGERSENGETILLMHECKVGEVIYEQDQKLVYVFDFFLMWCFFIDVIEVKTVDKNIILPRILHAFGDAPEQSSKSPELNFDIETVSLADDEEHDEFADMFKLMDSDQEYSGEEY